jgi:hypothetical protein
MEVKALPNYFTMSETEIQMFRADGSKVKSVMLRSSLTATDKTAIQIRHLK